MTTRAAVHRLTRLGAVTLIALGTTACTIGVDQTPRKLDVATTTTILRPTTTAGTQSTSLYLDRNGAAIPVTRELPDQSPTTVLDALVRLRPIDVSVKGATNAIPSGTEVLSTTRKGTRAAGTLEVNLSGRFNRVVGPARQLAVAQLVLTATGLPGVTQVRFSVDGKPVTVPTAKKGDVDVVTACDVASLLADPDSPASAGLSARSAARLTERSDALQRACA